MRHCVRCLLGRRPTVLSPLALRHRRRRRPLARGTRPTLLATPEGGRTHLCWLMIVIHTLVLSNPSRLWAIEEATGRVRPPSVPPPPQSHPPAPAEASRGPSRRALGIRRGWVWEEEAEGHTRQKAEEHWGPANHHHHQRSPHRGPRTTTEGPTQVGREAPACRARRLRAWGVCVRRGASARVRPHSWTVSRRPRWCAARSEGARKGARKDTASDAGDRRGGAARPTGRPLPSSGGTPSPPATHSAHVSLPVIQRLPVIIISTQLTHSLSGSEWQPKREADRSPI